jgi:hypothetical protein
MTLWWYFIRIALCTVAFIQMTDSTMTLRRLTLNRVNSFSRMTAWWHLEKYYSSEWHSAV